MGRIYVHLRSFAPLNNPEVRLIIKSFEYSLKEVYFVVNEEDKKYVEKYTKNVVSIDEVDGWLVIEYGFIPEIKNKDIKIIGFYNDKESFLRKYIKSIDHLKLNNFKNVIFLSNLEVILYKDGWWFYRNNELIEYTEDIDKLIDLASHPKGVIFETSLLKLKRFLENLSYDFLIHPLPDIKVGREIGLNLIYYIIQEILNPPSEFDICNILMYKDYTDVLLCSYYLDSFIIRVIIPTKEIKRKVMELREVLDKIRIVDVKNRTVIYDEKDLDKIIKLKELLEPSEK